MGNWEACAGGQVPSLVSWAILWEALASASIFVEPAWKISVWAAIVSAFQNLASASAKISIPSLSGVIAWSSDWLNALAAAGLRVPEVVWVANLSSANASAIFLRPMGG